MQYASITDVLLLYIMYFWYCWKAVLTSQHSSNSKPRFINSKIITVF